MVKNITPIILSLVFIFSLVPLSNGFDNNANKDETTTDPNDQRPYTHENVVKPISEGGYYGGHDTITSEGMLLKKEVHKDNEDFKRWAELNLPSFRVGAHDEDTNKWLNLYLNDSPIGSNGWGNFFQHFYNPDTGKGLKSIWSPATKRARDYIREIKKLQCKLKVAPLTEEDKKELYDYFGRLLHLLQDMAVPSHTKDDIHASIKPFENYVNDHWNEVVNLDGFKEGVTIDKYLSRNCADNAREIDKIMKDLANISYKYPNEEELYDAFQDEHGKTYYVLNEERLMKNVNELVPEAIHYTACYIDSIYEFVSESGGAPSECTISFLSFLSPGGDHPDDTFDVSDEFYWEREFKLTEADLIDLYLRTAIKKGKIGVWYKKRFMEIFIEGRTTYKDAPQETKDQIEAELQTISEKLEERNNQTENDWKGTPDIALFAYGFYNPSISLMLKLKEPVAFQGLDFEPSMVKDHPVMVIPSGGLYGLENSNILKAKLDEYVKNGGTLIVFTQQHGYEFSVLPVPQEADGTFKHISGYGWAEDQSCFSNAVYIDTYHQILAGQNKSTPTLNVDGYFTNYPSNATVLLRRTANGQPAMLMYDYGQGKVVVTSMYSDWASGHSQTSKEEIDLVRDTISWAKRPDQLPEIKQEQTVSVSVNVMNYTTIDASFVKLLIYDPDRKNVLSEQTVTTSIPASQSTTIPVSFSSDSTSVLGIYHIDYELYDAQGNVIQPRSETDSGRFAVSNPPSNPYQSPDFDFSIQSDAEYYVHGATAVFTFNIWNNTDTDQQIQATWGFAHHGLGWYDYFNKTLTIPAKGNASFTFTLNKVISGDRLRARFYDEGGRVVGYAEKGFWMVYPSATVTPKTDKAFYAKDENVTINASLKNNSPAAWRSDVKITVTDPQNRKIFEDIKTVNLSPYGTVNVPASFILPPTSEMGSHTVRVEAWYGTRLVSSGSISFELPRSQISIIPNLVFTFTSGSITLPITITNTGKINISSGVFEISLTDPTGSLLYSGSYSFTLAIGESRTMDISIYIPSLKFGNYNLTYRQSDETRTGEPTTIIIPNTNSIVLTWDKSSYRIREMANLTVDLKNTGNFNQENVSVTVSVPHANYSNTKGVSSIYPQEVSQQLIYSIPIPEGITANQLNVIVTLTLPSGSSATKTTSIAVPGPSLFIGYLGPTTLTAGDTINLTIENTGGVDTTLQHTVKLNDMKEVDVYKNTVTDIMLAGDTKVYSFQIPFQTANGNYHLYAEVLDSRAQKTSNSFVIKIIGINSILNTRTDKEVYLKTEDITATSRIVNGQFDIEDGSLKVIVNKIKAGTLQFTHFLPKTGGLPFYLPDGIAIGLDGFVYVAEEGNNRIQKFDNNGNFITKWGSWGTGDGQFHGPKGIAVSSDGSVYVADAWNDRIQKFDSNGNFITKWGSEGNGDGQFNLPIDVAVSPYGFVYVADQNNNRIQKFDSNGTFVKKWGSYGTAPGEFKFPSAISVSLDGSVYVAEYYRIQKFNDNGNFILKWEGYCKTDTNGDNIPDQPCDGRFYYPEGIATDLNGSVYVADSGNNRIQKFDSSGNFIAKWGSYGSEAGKFAWPVGIAIDHDGYVYVSDTDNNRIQKMVPVISGAEALFETTIPITQSANTTQSYTINIGTLNATGKLYLQAKLENSLGQTIAKSEYPFYIIEGNTALIFSADQKICKPGETIIIAGEVRNLSSIAVSALNLQLLDNNQNVYMATFDLPANGSYPFTVTTTAVNEGIYILTGKVTQDSSTLLETTDSYEVVNPKVTATISSPDIINNEPFDINIEIKNEGKVTAVVSFQSSFDSQIQTITIPAGETRLIQYTQQIESDTTYTFTFRGDINQTITKTVLYGFAAAIDINPSNIYPEGKVAVPVIISNMGRLDEILEINYQLTQQSEVVSQQSKQYYLLAGANIEDTLYFDLKEGKYQFTADCHLPVVSIQANFSVRKENKVEISISVGAQTNELIPVTVNLTNLGYNEINGSIQLSAINNQGQTVWNSGQTVSQLLPLISQLSTLNINPLFIQPGDYMLQAELLNSNNQQLAISTQALTIKGSIFQITQLPTYQTFTKGEEATFTFKIKNIGNKEGAFVFRFRAYDLIDSTQQEWLMPNEEKALTFTFLLPEDLEGKDYFAEYELEDQGSGNKGQVKHHLEGISLSVNATLDKQCYREGETAHLTIVVSQESGVGSLNLFARINYNGYEDKQLFTLDGVETLTFDIPITEITGEKLFYGIYHESGRSIHLNSLYIYEVGDVITITTNKQAYNPSETVTMRVESRESGFTGTLTLSATNYSETFAFTGQATKSFTLPSTMVAGTYYIGLQLLAVNGETYTGNHAFDVSGISVKIKESALNKGKYASSDTVNINFTIESNQNLSGTLKTWIVDSEGKYTNTGESSLILSSSAPLLYANTYSLSTSVSGIHRLVYGIYTGDLLLVSGSEAFDVGDAVLMGISTNKTAYPTNTEAVNVTVSMYGTVDAILELQLNGNTIKTQVVSLHGFSTLNIDIGIVESGDHILKAMLTAGGLKSTRETTFTYSLSLLDSDRDGMPGEWEMAHGLDPNNPADANLDFDNDGLTNLQEYQNDTNPKNQDTDNDGMPDGWEVAYGLNPDVNDALSDMDNDGFSNLQEYLSGSNPTDAFSRPNQPPVADAGADQNVITKELVTLDGSNSYDPEHALITYLWRFTQIPLESSVTDASLSDSTSAKPTFIPDVVDTYKLELIVNDGILASVPDEVVIIAATPNVAPNANAGPDQNVFTGGTVHIDASGSNDPDNGPEPLSYLWSFNSLPDRSLLTDNNISNRDKVSASFIPDVDGTYIIDLNVNDSELSSMDRVHVMATAQNVPPNADAGPDTTIYLGETVTFDGSVSNDPDNGPEPLKYSWRFVSVPTESQIRNEDISGADTVSPSFTPDLAGTYVLELMVSDGIDVAFDNMAVTVIKKATLCSTLGNDPKPLLLDQDIFKFNGVKGESVTIRLNGEPPEAGSGKRASLMLAAKIPGVLFIKTDISMLPNKITGTLPATGEYLIIVAEQPKIAKGERYRGAYCLSLEASQATMQTLKSALWVE
jgi:streptogramin lyase